MNSAEKVCAILSSAVCCITTPYPDWLLITQAVIARLCVMSCLSGDRVNEIKWEYADGRTVGLPVPSDRSSSMTDQSGCWWRWIYHPNQTHTLPLSVMLCKFQNGNNNCWGALRRERLVLQWVKKGWSWVQVLSFDAGSHLTHDGKWLIVIKLWACVLR